MAWAKPRHADHTEMNVGPFTLQAYQRQGKFDWEITANSINLGDPAFLAAGDGTNDTLEDAQDAALNALNEIIVGARGEIDAHMERQWKEETGRAHADQR